MKPLRQRSLKYYFPALLLLLGGVMFVSLSRPRAVAAEVRGESLLTLGGGRAATNSYIQTDCIIGQGIITGVGASTHYDSDPVFQSAVTYTVHARSAAELWAFYE